MVATEGHDSHPDVCSSHWNYSTQAFEGVSVLAVSSDEAEHRALKGLFDHTKWVLNHAASVREALTQMERDPSPVILTSQTLSDGDWQDLVDRVPSSPDAPRIIVTTHKLSAELYELVLRHGAFDILVCPIQASQLYPIVSDAWRQWKCGASRGLTAIA